MARAGLKNIGAEVHCALACSGASRDFATFSLEYLRPHVVRAGLLTDAEVERFLDMLRGRSVRYVPMLMVTAWGQRPLLAGGVA